MNRHDYNTIDEIKAGLAEIDKALVDNLQERHRLIMHALFGCCALIACLLALLLKVAP